MPEATPFRKLSFHARRSIQEASDIALFCRATSIEPKHLLFALFIEKGSLGSVLLENMGFEKKALEKVCLKRKRVAPSQKTSPKTKQTAIRLAFAKATKDCIVRAFIIANQFVSPYVGSEHFVYALLESADEDIMTLLGAMKLKKKDKKQALASSLSAENLPNIAKMFPLPFHNGGKGASEISFLEQYGISLTETPEKHLSPQDASGGRHSELQRMIQVLGRRTKNNPLLIGDPGVGKTTLVKALAHAMAMGTLGDQFLHKHIVSVDLALVVAGTSFRGEFEARLKEIIREASDNPNIILFIDEIHTLIGAGNTSGGLDAANILKPALSSGEIQCIGATTFAEYKKHIEKDPAFERRFQPIIIAEPSQKEAKKILLESKSAYETFHHIHIADDAIDAAVEYSVRFLPNRFLPDKAFDLLDEASSAKRQQAPANPFTAPLRDLEKQKQDLLATQEKLVQQNKLDDAIHIKEKLCILKEQLEDTRRKHQTMDETSLAAITALDIAQVVAQITAIPLNKVLSQQQDRLRHLEQNLAQNIIGQPKVIESLTHTLLRSLSGVSHPDRPLGSFLFLGPSGVGKTLTAKILSETLFEDKTALIRLDMSEFSERHSIAQIIGAPAGYVGYGEGGKLTEKIRRKPYSVLLLDEIEKAHPDVFNILLQILDDGMLTDAEGRRVSFRHTIIILTSNIGTEAFTNSSKVGFQEPQNKYQSTSFETIQNNVLLELKQHIRPEILNRLDHIIVFQPLDKSSISQVVSLELNALADRLKKQSILLTYSQKVVNFLANKSFVPGQGARLVRRTLQDTVENLIAKKLIKGKTKVIKLTVTKDTLITQ
jgi:ATP-dependent Clp protease ATP-binding subunit ClpC